MKKKLRDNNWKMRPTMMNETKIFKYIIYTPGSLHIDFYLYC